MIFAFHPDTNELRYHGPTRSSQFSFVFVVGSQHEFSTAFHCCIEDLLIAESLTTPMGLLAFVGALAGLGTLFSLINVISVVARPEYYKFQVRLFCQLILLGTIFGYSSVFVMLAPPTTATCIVNMWLINLSYVLVFGYVFSIAYLNRKLIVLGIQQFILQNLQNVPNCWK